MTSPANFPSAPTARIVSLVYFCPRAQRNIYRPAYGEIFSRFYLPAKVAWVTDTVVPLGPLIVTT